MESILLLNQDNVIIQEAKFLDSRHANGLFKRHSFCIEVDPDDNRMEAFIADPYIKVGNGNVIRMSSNVTRISLREPKLVYHKGAPGIVINSEFLKNLNLAMNYQSCYKEYSGTVLECINHFLSENARMRNIPYTPITSVDFTTINNYKQNGGDIRIC